LADTLYRAGGAVVPRARLLADPATFLEAGADRATRGGGRGDSGRGAAEKQKRIDQKCWIVPIVEVPVLPGVGKITTALSCWLSGRPTRKKLGWCGVYPRATPTR